MANGLYWLSQLITLFYPLGIHTSSLSDIIDWHRSSSCNSNVHNYKTYQIDNIKQFIVYSQLNNNKNNTNTGNKIHYLSKNPAFTLRISSIYNEFPDAKIICLIRDPIDSIPSMISYIAKLYSFIF